MGEDPELVLVHRDALRSAMETLRDEADVTLIMAAVARELLCQRRPPIVVAWNLEPSDRELWEDLAGEFGVEMQWLDTREPTVAARIPPLEP